MFAQWTDQNDGLGFLWVPIIAAAIGAGGQITSTALAKKAADKQRKAEEEAIRKAEEERKRQEEAAWYAYKQTETVAQRAARKCSNSAFVQAHPDACQAGGKFDLQRIQQIEQQETTSNLLLWGGLAVGALLLLGK